MALFDSAIRTVQFVVYGCAGIVLIGCGFADLGHSAVFHFPGERGQRGGIIEQSFFVRLACDKCFQYPLCRFCGRFFLELFKGVPGP